MPNCIAVSLTPIQRRHEVAAILGRGLLRLCSACKNPPEACDSAPESTARKALEGIGNSVHHSPWPNPHDRPLAPPEYPPPNPRESIDPPQSPT